MRSKGSQEEVEAQLEVFAQGISEKKYGEEVSDFETDPEKAKRQMAIAVILNVGSRSFSHFLNVLERSVHGLRASLSCDPKSDFRIELCSHSLGILCSFDPSPPLLKPAPKFSARSRDSGPATLNSI